MRLMKLVLVVLLIFPVNAGASYEVTDFFGLPWGASVEKLRQVRQIQPIREKSDLGTTFYFVQLRDDERYKSSDVEMYGFCMVGFFNDQMRRVMYFLHVDEKLSLEFMRHVIAEKFGRLPVIRENSATWKGPTTTFQLTEIGDGEERVVVFDYMSTELTRRQQQMASRLTY